MTTDAVTEPSDDLTRLHYVGIALATVTDAIHLILGTDALTTNPADSFGIAFVEAVERSAVGIIGVPRDDEHHRSRVVLLGILFATGQAVLYVALNWSDTFGTSGVADKLVQLALLAVLFALCRRGA